MAGTVFMDYRAALELSVGVGFSHVPQLSGRAGVLGWSSGRAQVCSQQHTSQGLFSLRAVFYVGQNCSKELLKEPL